MPYELGDSRESPIYSFLETYVLYLASTLPLKEVQAQSKF